MSRSLESFAEIGKELKFINSNELFLARYSTFMEFAHTELGISWQKAYWFIRLYHRLEQIKAQLPGVKDLPSEEGHMKLLDKIPDELLGAQWERVIRRARETGEAVNMRFIKQVVQEENVVREYGEFREVAPADPQASENGQSVGTLVHHRDVSQRSRCSHDEIRQIAACILGESWTLGRAIMFVEEGIHTATTIADLTTWALGLGPQELSAHLDSAIARIKLSMSRSLESFAEIGKELAIMGRKANTPAWYVKNKDQIILHPATRDWVEESILALAFKKR
jgi:hypothetical protein